MYSRLVTIEIHMVKSPSESVLYFLKFIFFGRISQNRKQGLTLHSCIFWFPAQALCVPSLPRSSARTAESEIIIDLIVIDSGTT